MPAVKILPDIYSVGVVDWNVRNFHGHTYTTSRGSTYNSYLILDEKVALIDTVYGPFSRELIENIRELIPVDRIDYIVVNHVETDHSGALPELMKLCPRAKLVGTAKCKDGLYKNYYGDWDFQVVKTGDELKLGRRTLMFLEAPMVHWPDSMFTYCPQDSLLMPNDAFGQHYATSGRFDDQVDKCSLMEEAEKYYANILWPLGSIILKKIEEVSKLGISIKMIAPSHGVIWRTEPARIIDSYISWAKGQTSKRAVIAYETMWGATEIMARRIADGIASSGTAVSVFDVAKSDRTEIITRMLTAQGFIFGSSTHDNDMLPNIASLLEIVKGLKPRGRQIGFFGSYGWAGGAVEEMREMLKDCGAVLDTPGVSVKYAPNSEELKNCFDFGVRFSNILNK
ncbi:MAG: flavodoxin domain-containing protein [Candidatus Omnitrophica bacterium]|nr:flavodoxin domain-containing protein [Candidatus Omnitrophota bacterium]MDD5042244.1 flavodoxin domain-containing protein [Candidatus Omnitrophota bacterium]MDD5500099.1 flavodoxin domain-containing protein [Candidatus Omnitrophota bacterium]